MSEKREHGEFYLVRFKNEGTWTIAETWLHPVRHEVRLRTTDGAEAGFHMVEQWGPRILSDPNLVQVSREELKAFRGLENISRRSTDPLVKQEVEFLDALRRRKGESP